MEKNLQEYIHSTIVSNEKPEYQALLQSIAGFIETRWPIIVDFVKQYAALPEEYKYALVLCKLLSEKYFEKLERDLTPEEKSKLQQLMKKTENIEVDLKILRNLEMKIKKTMIGQSVSNADLRQLVTSMNTGDIIGFCNKHSTQASLLVQLLDNHQLSELYNQMSNDKLMPITQMALSMELTPKSEMELLKTLQIYTNQTPKSLISGNLGVILTELPPIKENIIIDDLIVKGNIDQLRQITKTFFPSRLIEKVDPGLLKEFCQSISTMQKAEFLLSLEDERDFWNNIIAPEGSKVKEAIQMELDALSASPTTVSAIRRNADNIQHRFYGELRNFLSANYGKMMQEVVVAWLADEVGQ